MTTKTATARQIDTDLAALYTELYTATDKADRGAESLKGIAGAKYHYVRRQRVTDMTTAEALAIVEPILAAHADDEYGYGMPFPSAGTSLGSGRYVMNAYREALAKIAELEPQIAALEARYTGWSRFFLVTSSAGHIHSSMHCHTCRPTTRYGWLPELSGKDADTAVAELGPTLCTVCYPDAPTEHTTGKKITAAKAAKLAA